VLKYINTQYAVLINIWLHLTYGAENQLIIINIYNNELYYNIMENPVSEDDDQLSSFGTYKPIMELNKESFKEMQRFFVLKIIADNPDGITAYQLSTDYHINRSTVKLMLDKFEDKGYVTTNAKIIDGRTNKFYTLTSEGFDYLLKLKYKWFERFNMMEELTLRNLTNSEKKFYIDKIDNYDSKDEQLEYLRSMQSRHENNMKIYEKKYRTFKEMNELIKRVIERLESEDYLDKEELEEFFDLVIDMK